MKARSLVLAIIACTVALGFGRFIDVHNIRQLLAKSELVFVGRIKSVKPSGITTRLSYPTWNKVVFEWLRAEVEVVESIKGNTKTGVIQVAMLSVDETKGPAPVINAPGMVEPRVGEAFLFCVAPTDVTNLYAAITAPFDDNLAIFPLNRTNWIFDVSGRDNERENSPFFGLHSAISTLVDGAGGIIPGGAEKIRKEYPVEIETAPTNGVVYLQWEARTNAAGWTANFPKQRK
jgi:hypothetical protein